MNSLKNDAIKGVSWTMIEKIASTAIVFVLGIIIARLLDPSDYGIIGMISIFMAISVVLSDSGFTDALVQKKEKTADDYSTVYLFNIAISTFLYLILFGAAPWIARFYRTPILTSVIRVYTLQLVLNALFNVHATKLRIDLRFKELAITSLTSQLITGLIGVYLAYSGWGVWALVFQALASSLIRGILILFFCKGWFPGFHFSRESFKATFGFGSKLLVLSLIDTIYGNIYSLIIGRKFKSSDLGLFNRGTQLATFPSSIFVNVLVSVMFPVLSRLQDDEERLVSSYKKFSSLPVYVLHPLVIGLAVLATPVVGLLLGEKWLPCVSFLQCVAIGTLFSPLIHTNRMLLYAKGRSDLILKLEFFRKPVGILVIIASLPFGMLGLAAGKSVYELLDFLINTHYTRKYFGYGWKEQLRDHLPSLFFSFIMGVCVFFVSSLFDGWWGQLLVGVPTGILVYFLLGFVSKNKVQKELISIALNRIK